MKPCPDGWFARPRMTTCYYFARDAPAKTYDEATTDCKTKKGSLLKLENVEETVGYTHANCCGEEVEHFLK
jgi:hypothetical protein